jgi:hypothetical protein
VTRRRHHRRRAAFDLDRVGDAKATGFERLAHAPVPSEANGPAPHRDIPQTVVKRHADQAKFDAQRFEGGGLKSPEVLGMILMVHLDFPAWKIPKRP